MKNTILFTLFLAFGFLGLTSNVQAQKDSQSVAISPEKQVQNPTKYVMLATDVDQLEKALRTAELLDVKENDYDFEVLISGTLARDIYEKRKDLKKDFKKFDKMGARLVACEIALDREEVNKKKLHKSIEIVKDTGPYLMDLKADGFQVLTQEH